MPIPDAISRYVPHAVAALVMGFFWLMFWLAAEPPPTGPPEPKPDEQVSREAAIDRNIAAKLAEYNRAVERQLANRRVAGEYRQLVEQMQEDMQQRTAAAENARAAAPGVAPASPAETAATPAPAAGAATP